MINVLMELSAGEVDTGADRHLEAVCTAALGWTPYVRQERDRAAIVRLADTDAAVKVGEAIERAYREARRAYATVLLLARRDGWQWDRRTMGRDWHCIRDLRRRYRAAMKARAARAEREARALRKFLAAR